jgi:hypothetical protein
VEINRIKDQGLERDDPRARMPRSLVVAGSIRWATVIYEPSSATIAARRMKKKPDLLERDVVKREGQMHRNLFF